MQVSIGQLAHALAVEPTIGAALGRYDAERRTRDQATARGARIDGVLTSSRLGQSAMATMIRLTPAAVWRKILAPDRNPTWRWEPPELSA